MKNFYDPYRTTAKFNSYCSGSCGSKIKKPDPIDKLKSDIIDKQQFKLF